MALRKLLFVDANIWLDFYRGRNETGLTLLKRSESISEDIIVTYQLESEFKRNRHAAILEGMKDLKAPSQMPRPGIFSDAQATKVINKSFLEIEKRVKKLKSTFDRALTQPTLHDPVYQACQRIFHRHDSSIVLTRDNKLKNVIRRKAFRRFILGCPPRKRGDTAIGDAFNWEWMIHCAREHTAELVIVSRDSDYGTPLEGKSVVNDDLRQEFSERVSKKRKLLLYAKLSDALKHFAVPVTQQEEEAESDIVASVSEQASALPITPRLVDDLSVGIPDLRLERLESLRKLYSEFSKKERPLGETEKSESEAAKEGTAEETE